MVDVNEWGNFLIKQYAHFTLWRFILESEKLIKRRLWKNSPLWRGNGRNFHKSDDICVAHHARKKGNVAQSCQSAQSITHRRAPKRQSQIILWREWKAHAGSVVTDSLRVVGCGRLLSKWGCKCFVCRRCVCHRGRLALEASLLRWSLSLPPNS